MNEYGQTRGMTRVPLVVVGGGAAGMMAAIAAAEAGTEVILLERGPRCGRKLLITGGSRCNLTHDGPAAMVLKSMGPTPRFLRHAVHSFPPRSTIDFFEALGVRTTVAPDGCVFPESNRAEDVLQALEQRMTDLGVSPQTGRRVVSVGHLQEGFRVGTSESALVARRLVIATGGVSYPTTGSTGDGYDMARALGHTVRPVYPALSALETVETWPGELAGVSLDDVVLKAKTSTGKKATGRGDMLFAGWGISGPASLRLCWQLADTFGPLSSPVEVTLDLCPDLQSDDLLAQLNRLLQEQPRRQL
ncbi:MAG: aminoacetone oxidase family FAD-binding enzyme, partial [Planctomycetota bacterium]